jgi:hypothetical protein
MMSDKGNAFGTLLKLQAISKEPGPLDTVSPSYLAKWWKERGARTGKIAGDSILWD